jgi:hypothetical protein
MSVVTVDVMAQNKVGIGKAARKSAVVSNNDSEPKPKLKLSLKLDSN